MKILIATGFTGQTATKSSYILSVLYQNNIAKGVCRKNAQDYPMAVYGCFSSVLEGRLIVGGGVDDNEKTSHSIHEYDPKTDAWKSLPNMNIPRHRAKCCSVGKMLFVIGGYGGDKLDLLDSIECIRIDATTQPTHWTICQATVPSKLIGYDIVAIDDNIYLTGGCHNGVCSGSSEAFCGMLNSDGDDIIWNPLPPMLRKRSYHVSFPLQNKLFAVGGLGNGYMSDDGEPVAEVGNGTWEHYDPQTGKWTLNAHNNHPCNVNGLSHARATCDGEGKVIITGGSLVWWKQGSKTALSFDPETGVNYIGN